MFFWARNELLFGLCPTKATSLVVVSEAGLGGCVSQLSAADHEALLEAEDLLQLAQAALFIGKEADGADLLARAQSRSDCRDRVAR